MMGHESNMVRRQRSMLGGTLLAIWRNRLLASELVQRDVRERYVRQTFSWAWLVLQPAVTTLVYLIVFAFVFNARVDATSSRGDYVTFLLAGLIPWIALSDILNRAVLAVSGSPMFVKQMVFPVEVLPLKILGSATLSFILSSIIFIAYVFSTGRGSVFMFFGWPASLLCLAIFLIGSSYFLSAIGVFLKDIREIVQLYTSIGLFASPALFSFDAVSVPLKIAIMLNPATPFILMFQDSIFAGGIVHPIAWISAVFYAIAAFLLGVQVFSSLRPLMADVL
jgi:lipopolysaccharide transport system permease protein